MVDLTCGRTMNRPPVLFLWPGFLSAGGRYSRQISLWCLKTFSRSLLSDIIGLQARLTHLSLVGKTFLSDTMPADEATRGQEWNQGEA